MRTPFKRKTLVVKFRMAPNSAFAVLLRSPWWISFAIAGVIVAACFALLPRHLAPFAAAGSVPLMVIGAVAAWRQWRAPSRAQVEATLQAAAALPARELSARLERAWQAEGNEVQALAGGGADWRLARAGHDDAVLVSSRRCKAAIHGAEPLRALHAEVQRQGARAGVYLVLAGSVSDAAHDFARAHGIALLEGDALAALLRKAP